MMWVDCRCVVVVAVVVAEVVVGGVVFLVLETADARRHVWCMLDLICRFHQPLVGEGFLRLVVGGVWVLGVS